MKVLYLNIIQFRPSLEGFQQRALNYDMVHGGTKGTAQLRDVP